MTVTVGTSGYPTPQLTGSITTDPGVIDDWQIAPEKVQFRTENSMARAQVDPLEGTRKMVTISTNLILPQSDSTPAADPFVQQLIAENAKLRAERDQLASINARLSRKLATLRDGVAVLAERFKERE